MNNKQGQFLSILVFPIVLAVGIVLIPVVMDYTDHSLAEQGVRQTARWFTGHIVAAVAFPLAILAGVSLDRYLQASDRALPALTLPFMTVGAGLYAAGLGADGIGPVAVQSAGHSPTSFFDGSGLWITGVFATGTVLFGLGLLTMVIASIRLRLLTGWRRYLTTISAVVFMVAPMIPSGLALYGVAVATFGVFVPLAMVVRQR